MLVDQVVESWRADEVAVRAHIRAVDTGPHESVPGRSGMEMFEAIFAGSFRQRL